MLLIPTCHSNQRIMTGIGFWSFLHIGNNMWWLGAYLGFGAASPPLTLSWQTLSTGQTGVCWVVWQLLSLCYFSMNHAKIPLSCWAPTSAQQYVFNDILIRHFSPSYQEFVFLISWQSFLLSLCNMSLFVSLHVLTVPSQPGRRAVKTFRLFTSGMSSGEFRRC